jgi:integrase
MLNWAVSKGVLEQNPAAGVKQLKTGAVRRNIEDHELLRLATAMEQWQAEAELQPEPFRPAALKARRRWIAAIRLLLLTGARKNEILALRKDEFDEEARRLRLRDSKTGAKSIPLPATALAILKQAIAEAPDESLWVFPSVRGDGPMSGLQKVWTTICAKAGVSGVTIHSLRHTFASAAVNGGGSIYLASKVLGHADIKTTQGYSHADDEAVLSLADRTAELLASRLRVIEGGKANAA